MILLFIGALVVVSISKATTKTCNRRALPGSSGCEFAIALLLIVMFSSVSAQASPVSGPAQHSYPEVLSNAGAKAEEPPSEDSSNAQAASSTSLDDQLLSDARSKGGYATPEMFGAHGDLAGNLACTTTASSSAISCTGANFTAADVGKYLNVPRAGAGGMTLVTKISSVNSPGQVTVATAAANTVAGTASSYGHDDTAPIQSCWNASSKKSLACRMSPASGSYLVVGQLVIPQYLFAQGNSDWATNLWSEYNGPLIAIASGAVPGVDLANLRLWLDPLLPNSAGISIVAHDTKSSPGGGFWDSRLDNIQIANPAKQCLYMQGGGGGRGYGGTLPNQFIEFLHFNCTGPSQPHPAPLLEIVGQVEHVKFMGGQLLGDANNAHYPNAMVTIHNLTPGLNDAPISINFDTYMIAQGEIGLDTTFARSVSFENSWIEMTAQPIIANQAVDLTIAKNHIANAGWTIAVFQANGNVSGSVRDNDIEGYPHQPAALAVCTNQNTLVFDNNTPLSTKGCVQVQYAVAANLKVVSSEVDLNGDGGATPINSIDASISPGKTLSIYASGKSFKLNSGGNISFGLYPVPLTIPAGCTVTLRKYDLAPSDWVVESTNGAVPMVSSNSPH